MVFHENDILKAKYLLMHFELFLIEKYFNNLLKTKLTQVETQVTIMRRRFFLGAVLL